MSYQVLARKWRPRDFSTLVGQAHVRTALVNALNQGRLHHAYLFSGTRGVGKTTIARVLAKCFNCENGMSASPCLQCPTCLAIEDGTCPDFIEVDAASHTKVEDIRELLRNVAYQPIHCRFKVYVIDEAHMLSNHSFNALLKTLEEPPAHVKFLFATTDPQRLPITILSRCLQFNLKSLTVTEIVNHLGNILNTEAIAFEPDALQQIAAHANGSIRDALSTLDQAINFTNGQLSSHDISQLLGTLARSPLLELLEHLVNDDTQQLWVTLERIAEFNPDYQQAFTSLIHILYQIQLVQLFPGENLNTTIFIDEDSHRLHFFAQKMSKETVQLYYQIALLGQRDLHLHQDASIGFNMTILRMLSFKPVVVTDMSPIMREELTQTPSPAPVIQQRQSPLKQNNIADGLQSHINVSDRNVGKQDMRSKNEEDRQPAPTQPEHIPSVTKIDAKNWPQLLKNLPLSGLTAALAAQCTFSSYQDHILELHLNKKHAVLNSAAQAKQLSDTLSKHMQHPITLKITIVDQNQDVLSAQIQNEKAASTMSNSSKKILQDPKLQEWMTAFNAKVAPIEEVSEKK